MRRGTAVILLALLAVLLSARRVYGAGSGENAVRNGTVQGEEAGANAFTFDDFDSGELQAYLDRLTAAPEEGFSFRELMERIAEGDLAGVLQAGLSKAGASLFSEIRTNAGLMSQILLLAFIGAVFSDFSGVFGAGHVPETGFYVVYLLIMTLLAASFFASVQVTERVTEELAGFMRALLPAYFLTVALAGGAVTSAGVCGFTLAAISLAEQILTEILAPLMRVYMMLVLAGNLYKENMVERLTGLLRQAILWVMRTLFGAVVGFHLIQGLVLPQADALKNAAAMRMIRLVPGLGTGAEAVSQMVMGSGILIKNTAGAAAVAVLVILAAVPMGKLLVLTGLYYMAAAAMQPVCDKRLVACVSGAAEGNGLLLRLTGYALALFAATIAVLCVSTNASWYAG